MLEKLTSQLKQLLKQEYRYYRRLDRLAVCKKEAIIENSIQDLGSTLQQEQQVIEKLDMLEKERQKLLARMEYQFREKLSDSQAEFNFTFLLEHLPDKKVDGLREIRDKLLIIIDQLHQKNVKNRMLLEEAIKLNNFSYKMISSILEPENNTYNPDQQTKNKSKLRHLMDRKV